MAYIGKTPSQAVRSRYFYTATGGETSLSGADDNNDTLIFTDGNYVDVYLNGVLLVANTDYNVNTVNTISGLTVLTASDIVEIVVYDTFSVFGGVFQGDLSASTITGDMFGSHQFKAKNIEGSTIPVGTPVYIAGHSGNDPEIAIADADDPAKMPAFGITTTAIANNNKGNVIVFGNYIGLDTSSFSVGDELYVSNTGTLVNTRPFASADKVQKIARVIRSQSQNGQIFVMGAGRSNDTPNAITTNSINLSSSTTVDSVLDEDTMTSDSATALATQQSIKAYVDNQIGSNNELSEILTNGNTTGGNDISFGDNDKAIFGAGSDLQIYHDGFNSIVKDAGTGILKIQGSGQVTIEDTAGNVGAAFNANTDVALKYAGSNKLVTTATGVDVTGSVTASSGIFLDDTNLHYLYNNGAGKIAVRLNDGATAKGYVLLQNFASGVNGVGVSSGSLAFGTASTERMRIDSSGNVKIGEANTDVTSKLTVSGNGSANTGTFMYNGNTGTYLDIDTNDAGGTVVLRADARSGAFPPLTFETSGTERLRIDSSGNVLVGKTTSSESTAGTELNANGYALFVRDGNRVAQMNRLTSDGEILRFTKDGTTVGSIGSEGGDSLYIVNGDTGIRFSGGADTIIPVTTNGAVRDGGISLGMSSSRFEDLYLSGSISDGTNSKTVADIVSGGGGLQSQQVFSSSGTWTKPAGISKVKVYVVGGGGGAQNVASTQAASGGGGGLSIALIDVSGISSASITIGAGGNGSSSSGSRGGNGGTSSFGSYASATGGEGGVSTLAPYDGGEGGIGTTSVTSPVLSALNTRGNGGSRTGSLNIQQSGGGSFFGGGGAGAHDTGSTPSQGQNGTHGGGGGMSQYTTAISGGSGIIVIEEYA